MHGHKMTENDNNSVKDNIEKSTGQIGKSIENGNHQIEKINESVEKVNEQIQNNTQYVGKSTEQFGENTEHVENTSEDIEKDTENAEKTIAHDNEKKLYKWFKFDHKYMTICIYSLFVVFWAAVIFVLIMNWKDTKGFVYNLLNVLSPFFIALFIAYFLSPMVDNLSDTLQKYITKGRFTKLVKMISIVIVYIFVMGFIMIAFIFVIPQIGESINELTQNIPKVYRQFIRWITQFHEKYPDIDTNFIIDRVNELVPSIVDYGTNVVGNIIPMIFSVSMSIMKSVVNILLSLIISVYMINGRHKFIHQGKRLIYAIFSEKTGDAICSTSRECNDIFSAFLISKAIDSLIIGLICFMAMSILRLPYTVLLSVIVGITNMIPYFGPFIGAVPGVLIYLCTKPQDAIVFVIMIFILQQFDGLVLGPRLLGQSTGLNPMWVIFGITVGGAYFGVVGMFIGVPTVAVIAHLMNKFISYRLKGKNISELKLSESKANESDSQN